MDAQEKLAILNNEEERLRTLIRALCAFQGKEPPEQLGTTGWLYLMPFAHNLALDVASGISSDLRSLRNG